MSQTIGQLVRRHREAVGIRADSLAERASVPVERLLAFEEGGVLSSSALDRVADVLAVDPFLLRDGRVEPKATASLYFLHNEYTDLNEADRARAAAALDRALALEEVNLLLDRPRSLRSSFAPEPATPEAYKDGYRWARRLRAQIQNPKDPLEDVARLLEEQLDILLIWQQLASPRISALSVKDNEGPAAAVVINTSNTLGRRRNHLTARVDLLHEAGHILLDPANGRVNIVLDDSDESHDATHGEQRARAFAAEMLMPAEGLRDLLGAPAYEMSEANACELVEQTRARFLTPIEITVNHLVNREYIVHWLRETVVEAERARCWRPEPFQAPTSDLLERRVCEALARDMLTLGRARELLGLSVWDELPSCAQP